MKSDSVNGARFRCQKSGVVRLTSGALIRSFLLSRAQIAVFPIPPPWDQGRGLRWRDPDFREDHGGDAFIFLGGVVYVTVQYV